MYSYVFTALTQTRITAAPIGASTTSSQNMVSNVVGHNNLHRHPPEKHFFFLVTAPPNTPIMPTVHFHLECCCVSWQVSTALIGFIYLFCQCMWWCCAMAISAGCRFSPPSPHPARTDTLLGRLRHGSGTHAFSGFSTRLPRVLLCVGLSFPAGDTNVLRVTSHLSCVCHSQSALASSGGLYCLQGCAVNISSSLLHEQTVFSTNPTQLCL